MRPTLRIFTLLATLFAGPTTANAQASKIELQALVVANSIYHDSSKLPPIPAAAADGEHMERLLTTLQPQPYRIVPGVRADRSVQTKEEYQKLREQTYEALLTRLKTSGAKVGVVTFYFSGHGTEIDGESYLLPTHVFNDQEQAGASETPNAPDGHIRIHGVRLSDVFKEFTHHAETLRTEADRTLLGIFIIDACRGETIQDGKSATWQPSAGAPIMASSVRTPPSPPDMFVLYAASSGQLARSTLPGDDPNARPFDKLSVYTRKLSTLIGQGLGLSDIAQTARWDVHREVIKHFPKLPQTPQYFDHITSEGGIKIDGNPAPSRQALATRQATRRDAAPLEKKPLALRGQMVWECDECPELIVVPKGDFWMGSPVNERGHDPTEELQNHDSATDRRLKVQFAHPFAIGVTEVTVAQYRAFLSDPSTGECKSPHAACDPKQPADEPVTGVSWSDAQAYITWLNDRIRRKANGTEVPLKLGDTEYGYYRLPTESEWEYAARAGNQNRHLARHERDLCAYGNGADQSLQGLTMINLACRDGVGRDVARVKRYKSNDFGLFDVHGNAWEWVADCWTPYLTKAKAAEPKDDVTKAYLEDRTSCDRRVVRGGSWMSSPDALRLAKRWKFEPTRKRPTVGFRVARSLPR